MAQVDLVLAVRRLVVRGDDADSHLLEREYNLPSQIAGDVKGCQVEVSTPVEDLRRVGVLEKEELNFRAGVEGIALFGGFLEIPFQHVPGIALEWFHVGGVDVAENTGYRVLLGPPGKYFKGGQVGNGEHLPLVGPYKAQHGGAVKPDTLVDRIFELVYGDGVAFQKPENVGKPQPYKPHIAAVGEPEYVFPVFLHLPDSVPLDAVDCGRFFNGLAVLRIGNPSCEHFLVQQSQKQIKHDAPPIKMFWDHYREMSLF